MRKIQGLVLAIASCISASCAPYDGTESQQNDQVYDDADNAEQEGTDADSSDTASLDEAPPCSEDEDESESEDEPSFEAAFKQHIRTRINIEGERQLPQQNDVVRVGSFAGKAIPGEPRAADSVSSDDSESGNHIVGADN